MYSIFTFILVLFISSTAFSQSLNDRIYLKLPESMDSVIKKNLLKHEQIKKLNFGLSEKQIQEIAWLSKGKVDFSNLYVNKSPYLPVVAANKYIGSFGSSQYLPPIDISDADPKAQEGWWLEAIHAPDAWQYATGKDVIIADCDAGYFIDEPDLKDNLLLDYKKDLSDVDDPDKVDDGGYAYHGTAVVAIMSGVLDGQGTNGIAFDSKVVPLQNYNYSIKDDLDKEEATAQCILEAIDISGVQIIVLENQTYGSSETFEGTREAVKLALMSGITIVSAGGNSSNELVDEEEHDTGSIIVGALKQNNAMAGFSNYGSRVSIAAYGENLYTLYGPNGNFGYFGGTSGATPQVAGTVALMLEANPNLTPQLVKEILIETRETIETNKKVGGKLNTLSAVKKAMEMTVSENLTQKIEQTEFRKKIQEIL